MKKKKEKKADFKTYIIHDTFKTRLGFVHRKLFFVSLFFSMPTYLVMIIFDSMLIAKMLNAPAT